MGGYIFFSKTKTCHGGVAKAKGKCNSSSSKRGTMGEINRTRLTTVDGMEFGVYERQIHCGREDGATRPYHARQCQDIKRE